MSLRETEGADSGAAGSEPPLAGSSPTAAVEEQIESIAGELLGRLLRGEAADLDRTVAAHPELAPWLERRLVLVQGLRASFAAEQEHASVPCPHCGRRHELHAVDPRETTCECCGKSFHIEAKRRSRREDLAMPEKIGRFEVRRLLGEGAFGAVYEARDPELGRLVALKVPRSGRFTTLADEERFLREARSAAGLKHPGIVALHEVGEVDGVPFLVHELVDGQPLDALLACGRPSPREAAGIATQVAEALAEAHRHGVIHRDVKPANILVDQAGRPHLMDFGLARRDEDDLTVTLDGQILGTPAYMAPEQAAGDHDRVGPWSDVYGLGAVLFELLTGQQPFRGSRSMVIHHVLHDEPAQPSSLQDDVPVDLETICLKALSKAPARRYASAAELATDLRRFLAGQPIAARPVTRSERAARWARRNPIVAGLAAALFLLLLATACGSTIALLHARRQRDALDRKHQESVAAQEATARALRQNVEQMTQAVVEKATQWMDRWDAAHGLPWLARAMEMAKDVAELERAQRVRFGSTLRLCSRVAQLTFHDVPVSVARISPDGGWCLTGGADGKLRLWDVETGAPAWPPREAGGGVLDAVFSPGGELVAALAEPGFVRVWVVATGEEDAAPIHVGEVLPRLVFHPDGTSLLVTSRLGATHLWRWKSGSDPLRFEPPGLVQAFDFTVDGAAVLTGSRDGSARVWDAATGSLLAERVHRSAVQHILQTPADKSIVSIGEDGETAIWRAGSEEPRREPLAHGGPVSRAALSLDGQLLATATTNGFLRVWQLDRGELVFGPRQQGNNVTGLAFSPDGRWLASAANDYYVRLWNLRTKRVEGLGLLHGEVPLAVAFHPDGRRILSGCQDRVARLWDLAGWNATEVRVWHSRPLTAASLSGDGEKLLTAGLDQRLRVWSAATGRPLTPWLSPGGIPLDARFSPDGAAVAACGRFGRAVLWNAATGAKLGETPNHGQIVPALAFSPDGSRLATVDHGGKCRVFVAASLELTLGPLEHGAPCSVVAFARDGAVLVTGGKDGTVCLWDAASGSQRGRFREKGSITALDVNADGRLVAAGTASGTVRAWDAATAEPVRAALEIAAGISSLQLSASGRWLGVASREGVTRVWEVATGAPVTPHLDNGASTRIALGAGDAIVAVGAQDGAILLQDIRTSSRAAARFSVEAGIVSLELGQHGDRLLVATQAGDARIVDLRPETAPLEEARWLAAVHSSRYLDATDSLLCVPLPELRAAWDGLRARHPRGLGVEPERAAEWHYRQALACEATSSWLGALFHCAQALANDPTHARARELNDRAGLYQVLPRGLFHVRRQPLPR